MVQRGAHCGKIRSVWRKCSFWSKVGTQGPGVHKKLQEVGWYYRTTTSLMFPHSFLSRPQTCKLFWDLATYLLLKWPLCACCRCISLKRHNSISAHLKRISSKLKGLQFRRSTHEAAKHFRLLPRVFQFPPSSQGIPRHFPGAWRVERRHHTRSTYMMLAQLPLAHHPRGQHLGVPEMALVSPRTFPTASRMFCVKAW